MAMLISSHCFKSVIRQKIPNILLFQLPVSKYFYFYSFMSVAYLKVQTKLDNQSKLMICTVHFIQVIAI